jgi:hypothetical protein
MTLIALALEAIAAMLAWETTSMQLMADTHLSGRSI